MEFYLFLFAALRADLFLYGPLISEYVCLANSNVL